VSPTFAEDTPNTRNDGEPTDPQRIIDWLSEIGFDPDALGLFVSTPIDALLDALRNLGLITPEESDQ
jgi:hypothetical protein